MKRLVLNISFLLLFSCNTFAIEDNFESQSKDVYAAYFCVKEFFTFFLYHRFFVNHNVINNLFVVCKNCQYSISFYQTFGYFSAKGDEVVIVELKRLAYQGTVDELSQFIQKIYIDYQMICPQCDNQYH